MFRYDDEKLTDICEKNQGYWYAMPANADFTYICYVNVSDKNGRVAEMVSADIP